MNTIWIFSLIALWGIVLLNLLLTLRVVRWLHTAEDQRNRMTKQEKMPELSVGEPAPDFSARTLAGNRSVRLKSYAGQSVAFIFVSPHCGTCRRKMPLLTTLSAQAKERAGVEFVLVSDSKAAETFNWINAIHEEDGVEINIPVLIAPHAQSDFLPTYNPRGVSPYYCLIDGQGIVQARDPLGMGEWPKLQREWEATTVTARSSIRPPSRLYT
jgi:thiol-disulfide isomerase/thioredoxin